MVKLILFIDEKPNVFGLNIDKIFLRHCWVLRVGKFLDVKPVGVIFEEPELAHELILAKDGGPDIQVMIIFHKFVNFLVFFIDLVIEFEHLVLELVLLSGELLDLAVDPFRLSSGGAHELLLKLLNLSFKILIGFLVFLIVL